MQNSSEFQYIAIDTITESSTNPRRTFDESKLAELDGTADNKLTMFAIRLSLVGQRGIPRENEPDFLPDASKAFAKQKVQKTGGAKKPTLVRPITVAFKPAAA